jgi:hypothetical protein
MIFSLNLFAQHAAEGWEATVQGASGADNCNCGSCNCNRLLINYDNANNTTGSPENNPANPRGLVNSGYVLMFNDDFTSPINYDKAENVGGNLNNTFATWSKNWFSSSNDGDEPSHSSYKNVADNPSFFTLLNESVGTDKVLNLKSDKEILPDGTIQFNFARITSAFKYRYGYIEARIQIPKGTGMWSGFWTNVGVQCVSDTTLLEAYEEFDIIENDQLTITGSYPRAYQKVPINYHYLTNTSGTCGTRNSLPTQIIAPMYNALIGYKFLDLTQDFFIYGMEWDESNVRFYINNTLVLTQPNYNNEVYMMHLILGAKLLSDANKVGISDNSTFPASFKVDYVRAYKSAAQWANMIRGTGEFCRPNQGGTGTNLGYEVEAFIPGATYSWTLKNAAGVPYTTNAAAYFDNVWGGHGFNWYISPTTPAGNYTLQLSITPAGASTPLPLISKPIFISNPTVNLAQPGNITKTQYNCSCKLSVPSVAGAIKYNWWINGTLDPTYTNNFAYLDGYSYLTQTASVIAVNACGQSAPRAVSTKCTCTMLKTANPDSSVQDSVVVSEEILQNEYPNSNIQIRPNPIAEGATSIHIDWQYEGENPKLILLSPEGIVIKEVFIQTESFELEINNLKSGLYTLCFQDSNGQLFEKLMINP